MCRADGFVVTGVRELVLFVSGASGGLVDSLRSALHRFFVALSSLR